MIGYPIVAQYDGLPHVEAVAQPDHALQTPVLSLARARMLLVWFRPLPWLILPEIPTLWMPPSVVSIWTSTMGRPFPDDPAFHDRVTELTPPLAET